MKNNQPQLRANDFEAAIITWLSKQELSLQIGGLAPASFELIPAPKLGIEFIGPPKPYYEPIPAPKPVEPDFAPEASAAGGGETFAAAQK